MKLRHPDSHITVECRDGDEGIYLSQGWQLVPAVKHGAHSSKSKRTTIKEASNGTDEG